MIRDDHGFTLLELLIAASLGAIVLLGAGRYYVSLLGFQDETAKQAFVQRQGSFIAETIGKQVRTGFQVLAKATDTNGCTTGALSGLFLEIDNGRACIYRTTDKNLWLRCPTCTVTQLNLLSGPPVAIRAEALTVTVSGAATTITLELCRVRPNTTTCADVPIQFVRTVLTRNGGAT